MELIERYLQAVSAWLPRAQRDDIIRELSEELRSQAEEREEALGRPLDQREQESILKPFGHPMLLAARYRPQRALIGSAILPFYWFVLKVSLAGMVLVHVIAATVLLATGKPVNQVVSALVTLPIGPGVMVFGWVTLAFAVFDRHMPRLPFIAGWTPGSLPPLQKPPAGPSRVSLACEILFSTAFIVWWTAVPSHPWLIFGPASVVLELAPVWQSLYVPILLVASAGLIVQWIVLLRPNWLALRSIAKIVGHVVSLVMIALFLRAGDLVVAAETAMPAEGGVAPAINLAARIGLISTFIVLLFEVGREVFRLARRHQRTLPSKA